MTENNEKIKESFDKIYLNQKQLTAGQLQFIEGCKKHFKKHKELSDKQTSVINDIAKHLNTEIRFTNSI